MGDTAPISPLGYFTPSPQQWKYTEDAAAKRWRYWRIVYRIGLGGLFVIIAWCLGPNWINFGQFSKPTMNDLVRIVQRDCVPVVRAMKEYHRDVGRWPDRIEDLTPKYLTDRPRPAISVHDGQFMFFSKGERIFYEFTGSGEDWFVEGGFLNGPIPVPPVTISPSTRPATQPG